MRACKAHRRYREEVAVPVVVVVVGVEYRFRMDSTLPPTQRQRMLKLKPRNAANRRCPVAEEEEGEDGVEEAEGMVRDSQRYRRATCSKDTTCPVLAPEGESTPQRSNSCLVPRSGHETKLVMVWR